MLCTFYIAGVDRSEEPTEMMNAFLPGKFIPRKTRRVQFDSGSLFPIFAFYSISNRTRCKCVCVYKRDWKNIVDRCEIINEFLCFFISPLLKIGIYQVIQSVEFLIPMALLAKVLGVTLSRFHRVGIRLNGLIPKSQPRKDVGRHVLGMRGVGGDRCIFSGSR